MSSNCMAYVTEMDVSDSSILCHERVLVLRKYIFEDNFE